MNYFEHFIKYNPASPMIFTTGDFWVFFGALLAIFCLVYKNTTVRNTFLMLASMFFYYKSSGLYFLLIILSICVDYLVGNLLYNAKEKSTKQFYLWLSVVLNLSLLFFFKYSHFVSDLLNSVLGTSFQPVNFLYLFWNGISGANLDLSEIILPVGISFYTFQSLSYSIDIYRGEIKPANTILDYAFFVSFFPQLVAGPIVRAVDFLPQIHKPYSLNEAEFSKALFMIMGGLVKKIIISDYISLNFVDRVFQSPSSYTGFENLMACYGYTIQIYCDFSGYTDIAIGIALLIGFRLTINFNRPYIATDITDFWRRWHISLSTWLKDYLYISLGGNREGRKKTFFNLFATMVIGGLWHGAHLKFIIWGALHGGALIVHKLWSNVIKLPSNWFFNFITSFITFHFVVFCWIFFRADSLETVYNMLAQISTSFGWELIETITVAYKSTFIIIGIGFLVHFLPKSWVTLVEISFAKVPLFLKALAIVLLILFIYQFKTSELQPFIYFQF